MNIVYSSKVSKCIGGAEDFYPLESSFTDGSIDPMRWLMANRLYSRLLCDTAWSIHECNPAGLVIVDRSEVPDSIVSPPWPIDVALDMKTKTAWVSHMPREHEWYESWQKRNTKHLDTLVALSDRIEACLPVFALSQLEPQTPFVVDWAGQRDGRAYMRIETREQSCLRWIRLWCIGTISKAPEDYPLAVFEYWRSPGSIRMAGVEEGDVLEISGIQCEE